MKKLLFVVLSCIFVSTTSIAQTRTKATPRSDVANPAAFQFMSITGNAVSFASEPCALNLKECGNERIGLFGYDGLGGPDPNNPRVETFTFKTGKKTVGIYLLTVLNNEDDSVGGERIRMAFERKGNRWHFVQAGRQSKCLRGGLRNKWTKELCP